MAKKAISKEGVLINGWCLLAHPLFLDQLESLVKEVETLRKKNPAIYQSKNITKRLAAIFYLIFDRIPQDPTLPEYRQGSTLGATHKHWFRAKFFQQYRLFFRYHLESKIIVLAWVNDEETKRAYQKNSDAYAVFKKMLDKGHPPDDWNDLLAASEKEITRLKKQKTYN